MPETRKTKSCRTDDAHGSFENQHMMHMPDLKSFKLLILKQMHDENFMKTLMWQASYFIVFFPFYFAVVCQRRGK